MSTIMKTYLYDFDPFKPHFYIVKLGFTGVYNIFLSAQKHRLWYLLELGGSNEYPQSMLLSKNKKNIRILPEFFQFLVVKFSILLECWQEYFTAFTLNNG